MTKASSIVAAGEEKRLYEDLLGSRSGNLLLIPADGSNPAALPFSLERTIGYCAEWCSGGNECPDDMFELDCTHFVCHALSKSRILVNLPEVTCTNGVCVRVAELAGLAALNREVGPASNQQLPGRLGLKVILAQSQKRLEMAVVEHQIRGPHE